MQNGDLKNDCETWQSTTFSLPSALILSLLIKQHQARVNEVLKVKVTLICELAEGSCFDFVSVSASETQEDQTPKNAAVESR